MTSQFDIMEIEKFAKPAFLDYSMSVVLSRAIPDVGDGLKPVHRRILFIMDNQSLLSESAKPKKSAAVVGATIGQVHPHGDGSVYEAMVRLAQPFSQRYPLVQGIGNFGSRDGDSAAAMRYTECKLAPIAATLLDEMDPEVVRFRPNYDNSTMEPAQLPARLPFSLLNGGEGIAVGMASSLLPHNLREVGAAARLFLLNPKLAAKKDALDQVMAVMPAPDFPTGGTLISSPEDIKQVYATGRGAMRLRAHWNVETVGKSWRLVFTEVPQSTNTSKILQQINDLVDPKPREKNGKRLPLTAEQVRLKKIFGDLIDEAIDNSDLNNPIRLLITPKDRKADPQALALLLCAHTELELNASANMVMVDLDGKPRLAGVVEWLSQWCQFRVQTVRLRTISEKAKIDRRLHILAGRLLILDRLEEAIALIRSSDTPKTALMETFGLDDIQAEDVLSMQLRALGRMDHTRLVDEQKNKTAESQRLGGLLDDEKKLRKQIVKELDADVAKFGDERRTRLAPSAFSVAVTARASKASRNGGQPASGVEKLLAKSTTPEPVALALTERGWLAWRPAKSLEEARMADFKVKSGDVVRQVVLADRSQFFWLLGKSGRVWSLHGSDLPGRADTAPLTQFFDLAADDAFLHLQPADPDASFLVAGEGGYGFITTSSDVINRMKAGKAFLTLAADELPLPPQPLGPAVPAAGVDDGRRVVVLSTDGRAVVFPLSDIKQLPKGKGVALIGLAEGAKVSDLAVFSPPSAAKEAAVRLVPASGKPTEGLPVSWADLEPQVGGRSAGKKGRNLHKKAPTGGVFVRAGREGPLSPPAGQE
jgi:topoisomerase-4 subunit A